MHLKNIGREDLKIGDIVMATEVHQSDHRLSDVATVLEVNIDLWGEETIPSMVKILWPDGEIEIMYSDEVFSVNEAN